MLRFSSVNLNGSGAQSTHKLANLRHFLITAKIHVCFIQETKTRGLSIAFRTYFPDSEFHIFYTNISQGACILVSKSLLPEPEFDVEFNQSSNSSTSQILQNLTLTNSAEFSFRFSHTYCSPSFPIPPSFFSEINDFDPDVCLGDINVTTHSTEINTWLSSASCTLSENLVDFPTFCNHTTKTLTTTPDAVYVKPSLLHNIDVIDSGVIPGDHVRIDCNMTTPLLANSHNTSKSPPRTRTVYAFERNADKILQIWDTFVSTSNFTTLLSTLDDIKDAAREKTRTPTEFDDFQGDHDSAESANAEIDKKWADFVQTCNGEFRLGEVWKFIRRFEKSGKQSASVKISRNRTRDAYRETRKKCTLSKPVQKDKALKVERILKRYRRLAQKTDLKSVYFTRAELDAAVSGANKSSSPGVDSVTWKALPPSGHAAWSGILHAINTSTFKSDHVNIPPCLKNARLIFAPKQNGKLRPISIIVTLGILIERLFQSRIDTIISSDTLLSNRFGFIRKRSCEDVIGQIQAEIHTHKSNKLKVAMLALDLRSAYDLVQHADLIIALDDFLRRNNLPRKHCFILLFAESWLSDRKISFESTSFQPTVGLAQGSPISCSFFVIAFAYQTSPYDGDVTISAYFFADDVNIICAGKTLALVELALAHVVDDVQMYCTATSMILSIEKCRVIWFSLDRPQNSAYVSPVAIKSATTVKILGVTLDSHLTYAAHVDTVIAYIKKYMSPLRYLVKLGLSDSLSRQFALTIRSKITYGLYWFFKLCETRKQLLERRWRNVLRGTLQARRCLSTSYVYLAGGLPTITNFANYLLSKRAFFWHTKKVAQRPIPTIEDALKLTTGPYQKTRKTTAKTTSQSIFEKRVRESNPPTAALLEIVSKNQDLFKKITATQHWPDAKVRKALNAKTVPLYDLWSKNTRREIFNKYTPVFTSPNDQSQATISQI